MYYRIVVVLVLAAMFFGCGKNLTGPAEVVKSEAQMEGSNLEVSLPLPDWLKAKLSALPAGKLADGDIGPVAIYVVVSRTVAGGVGTQNFPLIPDLPAGVARGSVKIDIGEITVQALYSENGRVLFQSRRIPVTIAPDKKYQITFQMERVDTGGNVSFTASWDTTKVEEVIITDSPPVAVAKNMAFADRSAAMPTGVASATNVQIASFVITAGYEPVDIWQITMRDPNNTTQLGDNFQNLRLRRDGAQIGETIGTLDKSGTAATYSFRLSPAIRLDVREQYVVDIHADILSSPQDLGAVISPVIVVDAIGAAGVVTANNAGLNPGQFIYLQNAYISRGGTLTISTSADTPIDQVLVMGETDKDVFKFKLSASVDEDVLVSDILVAVNYETSLSPQIHKSNK